MLSYFVLREIEDEDERLEQIVLLQRMDRLYISELSKRIEQKGKARAKK